MPRQEEAVRAVQVTTLAGPTSAGAAYELGDFVCTEGDCQIGRALVREMGVVYSALVAQLAPSNSEFVRLFGVTVASLQASYSSSDGFWVHWLPFHPGCCTIKEIGRKAQDLTKRMREYAGVAQTDDTPLPKPSPGGVGDYLITTLKWMTTFAVVGAIGIGGYYGVKTVMAVSPRRLRR